MPPPSGRLYCQLYASVLVSYQRLFVPLCVRVFLQCCDIIQGVSWLHPPQATATHAASRLFLCGFFCCGHSLFCIWEFLAFYIWHRFSPYERRDFLPAHFQRLRDSRKGLLGFFAAFGFFFIWPNDRAQYESPLLVPARTRGPPPLALPACP